MHAQILKEMKIAVVWDQTIRTRKLINNFNKKRAYDAKETKKAIASKK